MPKKSLSSRSGVASSAAMAPITHGHVFYAHSQSTRLHSTPLCPTSPFYVFHIFRGGGGEREEHDMSTQKRGSMSRII